VCSNRCSYSPPTAPVSISYWRAIEDTQRLSRAHRTDSCRWLVLCVVDWCCRRIQRRAPDRDAPGAPRGGMKCAQCNVGHLPSRT
jgi:hypothetical protein